MPGTKKYSPPLTVTTRCNGPKKNGGLPGTVILCGPSASCAPTRTSWSSPSVNALPPFSHWPWMNSNWRAMLACRHMKITPRSLPSSPAPSGSGSPYGMPRRIRRWRLTSLPSKGRLSRGLARRTWAPTGQRRPSPSVVYEKALLRLVVGHDGWVGMLGRQVDRRAVAPAPDDLGREQFLAAGIQLRRLRELGPEGGHVLVELSVDEEGAVRARAGRAWARRAERSPRRDSRG